MDPNIVVDEVINLVPNWYVAELGLNLNDLKVPGEPEFVREFYTHELLTPNLRRLLEIMQEKLPGLLSIAEPLPTTIAVSFIQEYFAKEWLKLNAPHIKWDKLIDYLDVINERTYENQRVSYNFVISDGTSYDSITEPKIQKIFDPLATSMHTFIRVTRDIDFLSFDEIRWDTIRETESFKLYPEFLHPIVHNLAAEEYSVHQTGRGDVVIANKDSIVAAKRKGRWKIYESNTFKDAITSSIIQTLKGSAERDGVVGSNLFEIMFDLSFKRHGALLIYDPNLEVVRNVVNPESIIAEGIGDPDTARLMLKPCLQGMGMGDTQHIARKKRLFLEIASVDGAVIFTGTEILAFGAMIRTHEDAKGERGARSTAARSALYYGGYPLKISADGEISIFFHSFKEVGGDHCEAKIEFL